MEKYADLCSKLEVGYHLAGLRQAQIKAGLDIPEWGAMARLSQIRVGIAR